MNDAEKEAIMQAAAALTPEQWAFLTQFSGNYVAGRKLLCWGARAIVAIGMLAGAVAAILGLVQAVAALRGH